ncbi:hypothetical protein SEA_MARIETTA_47 [Gordonia phage Marietta]|uniref:Glycine-rich domain-containing protein n=1 Tax=Gordonia phage Marietta TaxID=2301558 RepID=A0A385DPQ6_9CAUD|nr:minor tail protein [Gordonia phage Marietta]AXQ61366.1 hypothetical protein SEA_MARIETTA_47 [Gordonia phage Marietta]
MEPVVTQYTTPGTYQISVPLWANRVDVVIIGGGGGGGGHAGASVLTGKGGGASTWVSGTLTRGVNFPAAAEQLSLTIGAGGSGSNTNGGNGFPGGASFVEVPTVGAVATSLGGSAGAGNTSGSPTAGGSPGNLYVYDVMFTGGTGGSSGTGSIEATGGTAPGAGGGGAGGGFINPRREGGPGARGQGWTRVRQG